MDPTADGKASPAADVFQLIRRAQVTAETNLNDAIALLETGSSGERPVAGFFPDGAFALARLYEKAGLRDRARSLVQEIVERCPEYDQLWWFELDVNRGTERYGQTCERIYGQLERLGKLPYDEAANQLVDAVLYVLPEQASLAIDRYLSALSNRSNNLATVKEVARFLSSVRRSIQTLSERDARPSHWCLSLLGLDRGHEFIEGCFHVNMSLLACSELGHWQYSLARSFVGAVGARLNWADYLDDEGLSSFASVSSYDKWASKIWKLLRALVTQPHPGLKVIQKQPPESLVCRRRELWVRAGVTEIWALWSFLDNSEGACDAAEAVARRAIEARGDPKKFSRDESWWPMTSPQNNIVILSINAGWYSRPEYAATSFAHWALLYERGLTRGNNIFTCASDLLTLAPLSEQICRRPVRHWTDSSVEKLLDGADVVFVTAFDEQIQQQYDSGSLDLLWKDVEFKAKMKSLRTIPAPMSIWPLCPGDSWSSTFRELVSLCRNAIETTNATVFLASCGAYGIPLVTTVHQEFNIASVYNGHAINQYFGITTSHFVKLSNFYKRAPSSPHWIAGDLGSRVPEIRNIPDGWRYI